MTATAAWQMQGCEAYRMGALSPERGRGMDLGGLSVFGNAGQDVQEARSCLERVVVQLLATWRCRCSRGSCLAAGTRPTTSAVERETGQVDYFKTLGAVEDPKWEPLLLGCLAAVNAELKGTRRTLWTFAVVSKVGGLQTGQELSGNKVKEGSCDGASGMM